jgi:uncharacterized protein (DUF1697 family)
VIVSSSSSYAAFLRGMNVGGHRLSNENLRTHFGAIGFRDVATFRASGNVIFAAEGTEHQSRCPQHLEEAIESGLAAALGYAVPSFIRSAEQVLAIAAMQPFDAEDVAASAGKLQVSLLAEAPSAAARREVLTLAGDEDRLVFGPCELYWLPSGGILQSALDLKRIERLLAPMTTRTKGTIEQIAGRYFAG